MQTHQENIFLTETQSEHEYVLRELSYYECNMYHSKDKYCKVHQCPTCIQIKYDNENKNVKYMMRLFNLIITRYAKVEFQCMFIINYR